MSVYCSSVVTRGYFEGEKLSQSSTVTSYLEGGNLTPHHPPTFLLLWIEYEHKSRLQVDSWKALCETKLKSNSIVIMNIVEKYKLLKRTFHTLLNVWLVIEWLLPRCYTTFLCFTIFENFFHKNFLWFN